MSIYLRHPAANPKTCSLGLDQIRYLIKAKCFRERKPNIQEIEVDYRRKRSPSIPYDRLAYSAEDHFMKGRWNDSEFQQTMRGYR